MNNKKILSIFFLFLALIDFVLCVISFITIRELQMSLNYCIKSFIFLSASLFWNTNKTKIIIIYNIFLVLDCFLVIINIKEILERIPNLVAFLVIDLIMILHQIKKNN